MSEFIHNKSKKIVFFGCWNETHYPSKENMDAPCFQIQMNTPKNPCNEYSSVIDEIKQKHKDIDFLVVAGDNYYPEKKIEKIIETEKQIEIEKQIKTKNFELTDFNKGFEALKSINKPTYLLLGNHDVDNIAPKEKKPKSKKKGGTIPTKEEKKDNPPDCRIIHAEIDFVKDSKIKMFDYKTELKVEEMQETNTLCIMVDTNIFIEKLDCYAPLLNESDKHWNKKNIIDKQKKMIETVIQDHRDKNKNPIHNVCFFGHHPLLCLKKREDDPDTTLILEETNMEWNRFLFHVLFENGLQDIQNKYYFCADLHQYQEGVVTITDNKGNNIEIEQYIAGTGGAYMDPEIIPDKITPDQITPHHERKISIKEEDSEGNENIIYSSYKMIKSIKENGYVIIRHNPNNSLRIVFHPVYLPFLSLKSRSNSRNNHKKEYNILSHRSHRSSRYLSRHGNLGIKTSKSLGGKTRRIKKRKSNKNKHY